jgi:hypothetical protein
VTAGVLENRVHAIKLAKERFCAGCPSPGHDPARAFLKRIVPNGNVFEKFGEILDVIPMPFRRAPGHFLSPRVKPKISQRFKAGVVVLGYLQDAHFCLSSLRRRWAGLGTIFNSPKLLATHGNGRILLR